MCQTSNLVAHWRFNDNAQDESGNGNHGTINGATFTTNRFDSLSSALEFNGSSDYVEIPSVPLIDNLWDGGASISLWFNAADDNDRKYLLFKSNTNGWYIDLESNGSIRFRQRFSGGGGVSAYWDSNSNSFTYNSWNHLVVVYNSDHTLNNPRIYLNGNQIAMLERNSPSGTRVGDIGRALDISRNHSNSDAMNGKLDDIRLYSKELDPGEVTQLSNEGIPDLVEWQYTESKAFIENGQVAIGSSQPLPGFDLSVKGKIATQEVKVTLNGWSDYVFDDDYNLQSLDQLESFIDLNSKLPGIPSENEVLKNGIQLGEMDAKLLSKIEELTLYIIELNNELKTQNSRIEKLEQENNELLNKSAERE